MASHNSSGIPLPIQLLLKQEVDEECDVFLEYEPIATNDTYTDGKLVAVSELTSAEYTITDMFSIPTANIQKIGNAEERRIKLSDCSEEDLEDLFNLVSIAYSIDENSAEIDNN